MLILTVLTSLNMLHMLHMWSESGSCSRSDQDLHSWSWGTAELFWSQQLCLHHADRKYFRSDLRSDSADDFWIIQNPDGRLDSGRNGSAWLGSLSPWGDQQADYDVREAAVTQQQPGLTPHRPAAAPRDAPVTFSTSCRAEPRGTERAWFCLFTPTHSRLVADQQDDAANGTNPD